MAGGKFLDESSDDVWDISHMANVQTKKQQNTDNTTLRYEYT